MTSQYIITRVETLRNVFQAVADGYRTYYDPDWRRDALATNLIFYLSIILISFCFWLEPF